jgi:hypothetical protein
MAWQLIYTSAPRLLEAGRTGFGTVARHRAVSGLLASTIERFSQFARLPGHDPRRIVYTHRIVTIGSQQHHVLSCLRDAGSDYTGRTNHIAHHVVAETREIRALAAAGITPADILMALPWRSSWSEPPRFLEAAEEIDLTSITPQSSAAWQQITGSRDHARLLSPAVTKRGCYVVIPPAVDARALFRESLQEMMPQAWQTTFTTHLESSDDVADFRWIGLAAESPMLSQAETSAREFFDLRHPESLPEPPPPLSQKAVMNDPPAEAFAPIANRPEAPSGTGSVPKSRTIAAPPRDDDESRSSRGPAFPWLKVLLITALVIGSAGGLFRHFNKRQQHSEGQARLERRIAGLWRTNHLKLEDTRQWLTRQLPTTPDAEALVAAHEACITQIRRSWSNPEQAQPVAAPDRMQDDWSDLLNTHAEWLRKRAAVKIPGDWRVREPADARAMLNRWADEKTAWRRSAEHFTREPAVDRSEFQQLKQRVHEALNGDQRPQGAAGEWQSLLKALGEDSSPEWLTAWVKLESMGNDAPPAGFETMMLSLARQPATPVWFQTLLREKQRVLAAEAAQNKPPEAMRPAETVRRAAPAAAGADALAATHLIHILAIREDAAWESALARLPGLPVEEGMTLQFGGVTARADELGDEWRLIGNAFRQSVGAGDKIVFEGGRLTQLPTRKEGCRLIARGGAEGRVLFELRIVTPSSKAQELIRFDQVPEIPVVTAGEQLRVDEIGRVIRRLRLVDAPTPQFQLRCDEKSGTALAYSLQIDGERVSVSSASLPSAAMIELHMLEAGAAELNTGIRKDREFIQTLSPKMADRQQRVAALMAAIAEKEVKLAVIADKMQALRRQSPTTPPPAGPCLLMEMTGMVRGLCRINITRSQP